MKKIFLFITVMMVAFLSSATNFYVSPTGSDTNLGTLGSPFKSLTKASTVLAARPSKGAGDTVFVRNGTYGGWPNTPTNGYAYMLLNNLKGTVNNPCVFINYPGEKPVFDFTGVVITSTRPSPTGVSIFNSDYLVFKGMRFTGLKQITDGSGVSRGLELNNCNWCIIEQVEIDHFQGTAFFGSNAVFDCTFKNCDAHHNDDRLSADGSGVPGSDAWDNADGFGFTGAGNTSDRITFDGCRAWLNCDDGWDNFGTNGSRIWKNCWSFWNGYYQDPDMPVKLPAGNGQGFKLGPCGTDLTGVDDLRVLQNCVAFENRAHGFDQNGEVTTRMKLLNCTAYGNLGYGFQFQYYPVGPNTIAHTIKNCASLSNGINSPSGVNLASAITTGITNNSWNTAGVTITSADFASISSVGADGPRQADGSLPLLPFMYLVAGSDLIDKGVPVGIVFCGLNPDLGAHEFCTSSAPPVVNAGADQTITLPVSTVTLAGSLTSGNAASWFWRRLTGPNSPVITNPNVQTTSATGLIQGVYTFELKVTDNAGLTDTDTMQVTVNAAPATAPTCSAGSTPVTIQLPTNFVALTATGASTSGNTVSFAWTQTAGTSVTINNANTSNATAIGLTTGSRTFRVTVTDNVNGLTCTSDKVVITNAAITAPTANAGTDQTITLPTNNTTLTGSGTGGSGTITGYGWVKIQGGVATITTPTSQNPSITGLVQGIYKFELTITASTGLTVKDTVQVTVLPAANIPPVANAGTDKIITLPINTVTLSGTGTDSDGTIVSYSWHQFSGPSCTITNSSSATSSVTNMVQGTYIFQLDVTDNNGAVGSDLVQVTVNAALATAPTCSANLTPATLTLPTTLVALTGTGASTSGNTVSYSWAFTLGSGTIASSTSANTTATISSAGTYNIRLTVTDNVNNLTCQSTKTVVVNPALIVPTANAGADQQVTLPTNNVSLSGSGSGGTINSYQWFILSGLGGALSAGTSANTNFTGFVAGTYKVQLRVGNTDGNFGYDTVVITVNPAVVPPTCNAGTDAVITLPTNFAALNGSATGTGLSFKWTKIDGSGGAITSDTSLLTSATGLTADTFKYELKVTDINSNIARDTVRIIVLPVPVYYFNVSAGPDQQLILPTTSTTLTGTATSSYDTILSYQWLQIGGPASTIVSPTSAATLIQGLVANEYTYSLTAITLYGWTVTDTVKVTVSAASTINIFNWFNASLINGKSNLTWSYTGANSSTNFSVEKQSIFFFWSKWSNIGYVTPKAGQSNYSFVDQKTNTGNNIYRVRYANYTSATVNVKKK